MGTVRVVLLLPAYPGSIRHQQLEAVSVYSISLPLYLLVYLPLYPPPKFVLNTLKIS